MNLINGKEIAETIKGEIGIEVQKLRETKGRSPHLAAI